MKQLHWFRIGSYGLILMAVMHFISNWNGLPISVSNPRGEELVELMSTYKIDFFGIERTMDKTIQGFIITWGAMLLAIAFINLSIAGRHPGIAPSSTLRLMNAITWSICLIAAIFLWSVPQISLFALIAGSFVLSLIVGKKKKPDSGHVGKPNPRIAIIGAGPAGLTAAWTLKNNGYDNVTVFEKGDDVGGKCLTIESDNHAIDIAAHEMLAGYKDVMRIADQVGAPSHGWQNVLVYNRHKKEYSDLMAASTLKGYSKLQVAWASIRYTWMLLTRYRKFAKPGTGLTDVPTELLQPVGTWLKEMNLNALEEIVLFVMKVQGYGRMDEVAAAYFVKFQGFDNWTSNVLHSIGLTQYWPRVMSNGFQDLWKRVAERIDNVRLNQEIVSIKRQLKADSETIGVEITVKDSQAEYYDKLIVTCPHDLKTLQKLGLDLDEQEKQIFSKVKFNTFVTTACKVQGIPTGVVGTIPLPPLLDYTGYIKVYEECDVTVFYTMADQAKPDLKEIYSRIESSVAALPNTMGKTPKVIEQVYQQAWEYFPHPDLTDMAAGYFDQLNALQGHRQTYYAGSLFEMETVGNTVANAQMLTNTQFPPLN